MAASRAARGAGVDGWPTSRCRTRPPPASISLAASAIAIAWNGGTAAARDASAKDIQRAPSGEREEQLRGIGEREQDVDAQLDGAVRDRRLLAEGALQVERVHR